MTIWHAIVLGIVQGLTEFLPISSSGHLIIFPWLLGWDDGGLQFDAALHLGTLLAVFCFFWRELWAMIRVIPHALTNIPRLLSSNAVDDERDVWARLGLLIVIASIPGGIVGLLFVDQIDAFFHTGSDDNRAIIVIAAMLIIVGMAMLLAERFGAQRRDIPHANWIDAVALGIGQALAAMLPGTSRSGATLVAGLFRGLTRAEAARFSFLAGIPLITAAGLLSVKDALDAGLTDAMKLNFLAGGVSAAVVGFITIWGLLRFLQRQSTRVFVIYRVAFGVILIALALFR